VFRRQPVLGQQHPPAAGPAQPRSEFPRLSKAARFSASVGAGWPAAAARAASRVAIFSRICGLGMRASTAVTARFMPVARVPATSTGLVGSRSSSSPATGASVVIGTVSARNTAATAQEACELWYTRLASAIMASPSPAEIAACSVIARRRVNRDNGAAPRWPRSDHHTGATGSM